MNTALEKKSNNAETDLEPKPLENGLVRYSASTVFNGRAQVRAKQFIEQLSLSLVDQAKQGLGEGEFIGPSPQQMQELTKMQKSGVKLLKRRINQRLRESHLETAVRVDLKTYMDGGEPQKVLMLTNARERFLETNSRRRHR